MRNLGFSAVLLLALAACNSAPSEPAEEAAPEEVILSPEEQAAAEEAFLKELEKATKPQQASYLAMRAPTDELRDKARKRAEELFEERTQ